jgi:hypothetical protein
MVLSALLVAPITAPAQTFFGNGGSVNSAPNLLNQAFGYKSLFGNTSGYLNTAIGAGSLQLNTSGYDNVANGYQSLISNVSGYDNTAGGYFTLLNNYIGYNNLASGSRALYANTTGYDNTADGVLALSSVTTGYNNTAIGWQAGYAVLTGIDNIYIANTGAGGEVGVIRIGTTNTQTSTYISGINGVASAAGTAVYINARGQLGTLPSSRRFKYDIRDMGQASNQLSRLRPVSFRYKAATEKGTHPLQFGLIAEEVAAVYPNMVQYDKAGKPFTVFYQQLTPMMLNELQKLHREDDAQSAETTALRSEMAALKQTRQRQEAEFASLQQTQRHQVTVLSRLTTLALAAQSKTPVQKATFVQN